MQAVRSLLPTVFSRCLSRYKLITNPHIAVYFSIMYQPYTSPTEISDIYTYRNMTVVNKLFTTSKSKKYMQYFCIYASYLPVLSLFLHIYTHICRAYLHSNEAIRCKICYLAAVFSLRFFKRSSACSAHDAACAT